MLIKPAKDTALRGENKVNDSGNDQICLTEVRPCDRARNEIENIRRSKKLRFQNNSGCLKLSTIHSFKGWEVKALILIIEKRSNDSGDLHTIAELIYTALTRCRQHLVVINLGDTLYHDFFSKHPLIRFITPPESSTQDTFE